MHPLARLVVDVPDFPKPGILFRDITPLLRSHFWRGHRRDRCDSGASASGRKPRRWPASSRAASSWPRRSRKNAARDSCRSARRASCRRRSSNGVIRSNTATGSSRCSAGRAGSSSWTTCSRPAARSAPLRSLRPTPAFSVLHTGVLIDLGIVSDFRCLGEAPRSVIRYGG